MISALVEQHKVDNQQAFAPAPSERRGECPTLQKPMQTGDGLLARLRPVDNLLTLPQLRALAEAAERFGNGIIEITARGSLQVRGLKPETVTPFESAVLASSMRIASGVGVETPPLAGIDPDELIDVRPLAAELRRRIAEHVPPLLLAPKLAITLDGGGRFHLGHVTADIKVTAFSHNDRNEFLLAAGGRTIGIVEPDRLIDAIVDLLEKLDAIGPRARGRDLQLPEFQGQASQREPSPLMGIHRLSSIDAAFGSPPSVLPDISPSRGEIGCGAGVAPYDQPLFVDNDSEATFTGYDQANPGISTSAIISESAASHSPPVRGRWPAGQRGVAQNTVLTKNQSDESENVTESHQPEYALGLAFAYRQANSADLTAFADTAEALGASEVRLAPDHSLFVTGLTLGKAQQLQKTAATLGFLTSPDDPRRAISLCAGARGCASAFYDTQGLAEKLLRHAPDLFDGSFDLHLSGCAKGCAHPAASLIAFVGARAGYGLVVNGAASGSPATYIAQNNLDTALTRLQALLQQSKEDGETAQACLARLGGGAIAAALQLDGT